MSRRGYFGRRELEKQFLSSLKKYLDHLETTLT
jgi:hypothetical protein